MTDLDDLFRPTESVSSRTTDPTGERNRDWWREQLADAPPLHDLPTDFERRATSSNRTERRPLDWEDGLGDALRSIEGIELSPPAILSAGFAALVRRYTGARTAVVGIPYETEAGAEHARRRLDILPVRLDFRESTTFRDLLAALRDRGSEAREHLVGSDELVEALEVERQSAHRPITQLAVGALELLETRTTDDAAAADELPEEVARLDLSIWYAADAEGLEGAALYDPTLFSDSTIERLLNHLRHLLEQATTAPDAPIDSLALVTPEEERQILGEWNDTDVPVDLDRCFHDLFEAQVDRTPEHVAVVEPGGGSLTYRELDRRANRLAHLLLEKGVEPEDLIAICTERSLRLVVGILGILKSGAAYLPLNPTYPEERIDFILEETAPPVAVTESGVAGIFGSADSDLVRLDADRAELRDVPESRPDTSVEADNLAYVVYTSGSTGRPKGVMNEHRNVVNLAATLGPAFGVESDDRVSQFVSETFDATIWEFAMTFTEGATLVLLPSGHPPLGLELGRYLRDQEVTLACLPPAVVPDIPKEMAEGVDTMVVAGEACPAKVVEQWAPGRRFINGYGPREATAYATCADCEPGDDPPPIGRPLGNYKTYVLDERGELLPAGVEGELYIGGPGVGRGYLDRPELNEEKFVSDPFAEDPGARMYRTGDVVRWRPDGELVFVGRRDFQVQLRGFRVELGAIEEELRSHGAVRDAVATKDEPEAGPERLVGYVIAEPDEEENLPERLHEHLAATLPEYMVPSRILVLEEFPLNTTGKIDRHALPSPDARLRAEERDITPPATATQEALAEEWSELLSLEEIGIEEDFFELGGTSLMVARLALRIRDRFEVDIPVRALYETPTVEAIAERIDSSDDAGVRHRLCFDPSLRLEEEAELAADIDGEGPTRDDPADPDEILLTGATGFVGTHLLAELLEQTEARIHCLVRADDRDHARDRIRDAFTAFRLDPGTLGDRVRPLAGDLAEKRLGLDEKTWRDLADRVDAIYHNGAMVDQVRSYESMKGPNVDGTERMLRFAGEGVVTPFHYVSTTGSVHYPDYADEGSVPEDAPAGPLGALPNGYMQTKCVGEHMVQTARARGIPGSIYRLGAVSGHTQSGASEPDDFTYSILRTAIELGLAPDLNPDLMITPVDFVARSIATLSRWEDGLGEVFHVTHPDGTPLRSVCEQLGRLGYDIDVAAFDRFLDRLSREARRGGETPLVRFLPYLSQRLSEDEPYKAESYYRPVGWDCENLVAGLDEMGAPSGPPPLDELLPLYLDQLQNDGKLRSDG